MPIMLGDRQDGHKVVVSLFDHSGNWSRPFNRRAGFTVIHYDIKHGTDLLKTRHVVDDVYDVLRGLCVGRLPPRVVGVLMAPPCTEFSGSGAQWWPAKDADGRTDAAVKLVRAGLAIRDALHLEWWALENPAGRLPRLVPELGRPAWYFHPHEYAQCSRDPQADRYTKRTGIWTNLPKPEPRPLDPIVYESAGKRGSWHWAKLGGKSERTKELRSITPQGFAEAFAQVAIAHTR